MILLVEDEAVARINFAATLRAYGYEVMEATDGAEALALVEQHHRNIDLVITDMVLPKINGLNLVGTIQTRWPRVPVIMVSAYLSKEAGNRILGPDVGVLEKPVRPSALIALVQRLLPHPQNS